MNRLLFGKNAPVLLLVSILVALLTLSTWHLWIKHNSESENTTVTFAAPLTIAAAPAYVAEKKGFWKRVGLNVRMVYFNSGREALDALVSGSANLASVSETPPLRGYVHGHDVRIVTSVSKNREAKMTVRKDQIRTPDDVKGKKIGTIPGTNSDYYLYTWLRAHNITLDDVHVLNFDPKGLSQAFVQGDVDIMFAWEPHNFNAYSKVPSLASNVPTELYEGRQVIVMEHNYLEKNQQAAERLMQAFILAERYIGENPDESKKIVQEATGVSASAIEALWAEYEYSIGLDSGLMAIIEKETEWIIAGKAGKPNIKLSNMIDSRPLKTVDAKRVEVAY